VGALTCALSIHRSGHFLYPGNASYMHLEQLASFLFFYPLDKVLDYADLLVVLLCAVVVVVVV